MKKKIIYFLLVATMFAVPVEGNSVVIQAADQALDVDEFSTDIVDDEEAEVAVEESEGEEIVEDEAGSEAEAEQEIGITDEEDGENGDLSDGEDQEMSVYGWNL